MILHKQCENCRKNKFYIPKIWESVKIRQINIAKLNQTATSRKRLCADCHKKAQQIAQNGQ